MKRAYNILWILRMSTCRHNDHWQFTIVPAFISTSKVVSTLWKENVKIFSLLMAGMATIRRHKVDTPVTTIRYAIFWNILFSLNITCFNFLLWNHFSLKKKKILCLYTTFLNTFHFISLHLVMFLRTCCFKLMFLHDIYFSKTKKEII